MLIAPKKQEIIHYQLVITLAMAVAVLAGYTAFSRHQSLRSETSTDRDRRAHADPKPQPVVLDINQINTVKDTRLLIPRNILFTYVHYRAKSVSLIGNFNDGRPIAMQKEKLGVWRASVPLKPGSYTYNYLVDGKKVPDPYNSKRADEASVVIVEPAQEKE
ncbi:MAG: hypothetical protein HY401_04840 [Elusimicrobia bacterium]|nr:hypothetical protein [Elusimicrobiota bacterium]